MNEEGPKCCRTCHRKLKAVFRALDNFLGDTDPDFPEDMTDEEICNEEPVFWAAKELSKLLQATKKEK